MNHEQNTGRSVLVHVADAPRDLQRAIHTAQTLKERFPDVRIRIVVNGPALTAIPTLVPDEVPENVGVAVCAIGLQRHDVAETDVPDGIEVVPAAPLVIIEEQFNGAAYLRL